MTDVTQSAGYQKAKEVADKLKEEVSLATSMSNSTLALLRAKAKEERGIEVNEGGSLPMLTLIQSSEFAGEIVDGSEPIPGYYYYKPRQIQIEKPVVNIVYVKECRLDTEYQGVVTKNKAHYLIAGVLDETNEPFVMYIKGLSYGEVVIEDTSLMTQTRPWRKHKDNPVPMYALKIQLDSAKKDSDWGKKRATTYKLLTDANGLPILVDEDRLEMLDMAVDSGKNMIDGVIERNKQGEFEDENIAEEVKPTKVAQEVHNNLGTSNEDIVVAGEIDDEPPF